MNFTGFYHFIRRNPMDRDLIVGQVVEQCPRSLARARCGDRGPTWPAACVPHCRRRVPIPPAGAARRRAAC